MSQANSCPRIRNFVDNNCDQKIKIVVVGDSIVKGIGDLRNKNNGGYVKRLQKKLPAFELVNQGYPGFSSSRLLQRLTKRLNQRRPNTINTAFEGADIVIVDAGRNDFFGDEAPAVTVNNLERIVELVRATVGKEDQSPPYVAVATLGPTKRGFQRPFIEEVNTLLLQLAGPDLPVAIRFDSLEPEIISDDGIHPTSAGYTALFRIVLAYLRGEAQAQIASDRPDRDSDGIYDLFEASKFGTDPDLADSDGDGLNDGREAFNLKTDPALPDTDGDGVLDGDEVASGSDPLTGPSQGPA